MASMLLGELLIKDGVLGAAQVEEALEAQVVHGGRIGTNLLELGHLGEEQLARALGRQHQVYCAHGAIVPSAQALSLLPANVADDKDVLPVRVDGHRLYLLVVDPDDIEARDYVATVTGLRVVPVVVAEFRMAQLQRRYCKAFRPVRELDLDAARRRREAALKASAAPAADLMSEDEFQTLYAEALSGHATARPGGEEHLEEALIVEEIPEAEIVGELVPDQPPAVESERRGAQRRAEPLARPAAPERRRRDRRRAPRPVEAAPISFAEAQKALATTTDREDVARVVLRFAAGSFRRALLLQVQRDSAIGWLGSGVGLAPDAARKVALSLTKPSAFKLVRDSRSHFLGPLRRDFPTVVFLRALGEGEPRTAVLMPLLAAGRVVNILYADNGPGAFANPDIGELLILAQKVGRSYEAMIAARHRQPLPPPVG